MFKKQRYLFLVLLVAVALVACRATPTAAPTATSAPAAAPTSTTAPTATPVPEPTATPTEVPPAVYKIGTNAEYPPFENVDASGEIVGFDVDLMTAIADAAGFEFEWVNTRWDGIFVALQSGEFDAVISAATITEERAEIVNFSDPYFNAGQMIAVRAGEAGIAGPSDLAGKKVGVQLGTTGDIWLTEQTEAEVVRFDENTLAFQALANGDVDAAVADGPTAIDIVKANPEMGLTMLDGVYTEESYGIAVNKEQTDLLAMVNAGLAAIQADGTYDAIYDKWFAVPKVEAMPTYKIGTNAEYPPFENVDASGEIVGFDVEMMTAIAEAAGFKFEWVNTRWDGIFVALQSGEFDAVISAATITEERAEIVNFSNSYFDAGQMIAVRADETRITGPADLAGKKVGVQLGTTGDIWLTEETGAEVVRFDENTLAFQALANGDVDAAVADGPTAIDIVKANPEMNLTVLAGAYTEESYGIAVNKEQTDLLAMIDAGLAAIQADGTYDAIYDKWFSVPDLEGPATVYKIGTNAEYPPFENVDASGEIVGFDVDLMTAIAEAGGFKFEWVNTRWDGIFVALQSGEFDAVISAATITEERAEIVNFSDPYFNAGQMIAVRADETEITGPSDLAGKKVGVQLGTTGDIWLTEETGAEVVRFDENTLAFQALANGDVDAAVADGPTAIDIVKANPEMGLTMLDGVYTQESYGIAVNRDRAELLDLINAGLAVIVDNGTYDALYDKWFSVSK